MRSAPNPSPYHSTPHTHSNTVAPRVQTEIINRLSGGGASGRAAAAAKALEKIKGEEAIVTRPFVPKKRSFAFPSPERMGQRVLEINGLTHGYGDRALFDRVDLEIEKGERVAVIGALEGVSLLGSMVCDVGYRVRLG